MQRPGHSRAICTWALPCSTRGGSRTQSTPLCIPRAHARAHRPHDRRGRRTDCRGVGAWPDLPSLQDGPTKCGRGAKDAFARSGRTSVARTCSAALRNRSHGLRRQLSGRCAAKSRCATAAPKKVARRRKQFETGCAVASWSGCSVIVMDPRCCQTTMPDAKIC